MLLTLESLRLIYPETTATLPTLPTIRSEIDEVFRQMPESRANVVIDAEEGSLFRALAGAHGVLAASGTVTLQTALYGVPGVACYITSALSAAIGRRLVRMERVILPNTLLGREVYPFLFQEAATPRELSRAILDVLGDDQAERRSAEDAAALRRLLRGNGDSFEANVVDALARWLGPPNSRSSPV